VSFYWLAILQGALKARFISAHGNAMGIEMTREQNCALKGQYND